jgi:NADPH-dependent 2,4-dienoyl-CoA reductase/sulfur reductase-like enzyme
MTQERQSPLRAIIVGASVTGTRASVLLREAGFDGEIVLIGGERHVPYDRARLSKQLLVGAAGRGDIALPDASKLAALGISLRLGTSATALDLDARQLAIGDESLAYDGLIIATGAVAAALPNQPVACGVHVLRTLDDALALQREIAAALHVVLAGAGFIGLEVASAATALGVPVTIVELARTPLARILPGELGSWFPELHRGHGVDVRCGTAGAGFELARGRVAGLALGDGSVLATDLVVVGVGAKPATGWLEDSGLTIEDGVVCDRSLRAADRVYAAGDIARWPHPLFGFIRVERWTTAIDHAWITATNLAAELVGGSPGTVAGEIPDFWSDQHDVKVQMAGWTAGLQRRLRIIGWPSPRRSIQTWRRGRGRARMELACLHRRTAPRDRRMRGLGSRRAGGALRVGGSGGNPPLTTLTVRH